jgi:C-terminal processing protease CtpA/Prc
LNGVFILRDLLVFMRVGLDLSKPRNSTMASDGSQMYMNDLHVPRVQGQFVGIGLTFVRDKVTGSYVVKRVINGGPACKSCKIKQGDAFLEVDGIIVKSLNPEDLCRFPKT